MKFEDFVARLGAAGVEASKAIGNYSQARLLSMFEGREDEVLHPKHWTVKLAGQETEVPLLSLLPDSRLEIGKMEVGFKAHASFKDGDVRLHHHKGLLRRGTEIDVRLTFRAKDNAEGTELLREAVNRQLAFDLSGHAPKKKEQTDG